MKFLCFFLFANFIFIFPFSAFVLSNPPFPLEIPSYPPETIETLYLYKNLLSQKIDLLPEDNIDLGYISGHAVKGKPLDQYKMAEMIMRQAMGLHLRESYRLIEIANPWRTSLLKAAYHMEAFGWYRRSAEKYLEAQYKLAFMYALGLGTRMDLGQAIYWYNKAAQKGHKLSKEMLENVNNAAKFLNGGSCKDSF